MPPPSLSSSTIVSCRPRRRAASRPPTSCGERDVADQQHDRPVRRGRATPNAVETVPSIPLAPRLESTRGGVVARRGRTSRRRAPASRRRRPASRRRGSAAPSSAATRGSLRPSPPSARAIAAAAARSARRQRSSQSRSRGARCRSRQRGERGARVGGEHDRRDAPAGSCHAPSGSNAICSASSSPCSHWRSGLEVGRSPTRSTSSGACAPREGRVAQQRVVVRDRGGAAARAGQRLGEQRDRGAVGERGERGAEPRVALGAPGDQHARAGALELGGEPSTTPGAARRGATRARDPRPPAGAPAAARLLVGQRLVEHERLAQREVQVHRAGAAVERGPERAAGELAQPAHPLRRGRRGRRPRGTTWPRCRRA